MPPPSPLPSGRRAITDGAAALVTAAAVTFVRYGVPPELASPLVCPGIVQRLATESARLAPDLPLGTMLLPVDTGLAIVVVAVLAVVTSRLAGSSLVGAALGAAAAGWPAFGPVLDAGNLVTLLASALAIGGLLLTNRRIALVGAVGAGFSTPASAVAMGGWIALWPQPGRATGRRVLDMGLVAAAGAVSAWAAALTGTAASATSCLLPAASVAGLAGHLESALSGAGPYLLGLVILALVAHRLPVPTLVSAVAATVVLVWTTDAARPADGRTVLVTLFLLGAPGLAALRRACGSSLGGQLAATFFLLLLPWLQLQSALHRVPAAPPASWGHRDLTLTSMRALLAHVPAGVALVDEDVATAALLSAAPVPPARMADDPARISAALRAGTRIYALPTAQARLQYLGFQLGHVEGAPGLAAVTVGGECRSVTDRWRPLPDVLATSALTLVARDEREVGPVVVYLAFESRPTPRPLHWPTPGHRGLYVSVYVPADDGDAAQLETDTAQDDLPRDLLPPPAAFVARLELWRTPGAPRVMAVDLGVRPFWSLAQVNERAVPRRVTVCPAFPYSVRALAR